MTGSVMMRPVGASPPPMKPLGQTGQPGLDWAGSQEHAGTGVGLGTTLNEVLTRFALITLDASKTVAAANRLDTKFTFGLAILPELLERLTPHYFLLTIHGVRAQRYQTLYFDTPKLDLYLRHHSGIYPRHKVRCRRYLDSDVCFLETKTKRNTGRTIKQRIPSPWVAAGIMDQAHRFLQQAVPGLPTALDPVLRVDFFRLTLVNKDSAERVTIDVDLSYRTPGGFCAFPKLVIAEVKRERSVIRSPFLREIRDLRLRKGSISKYCLGIMALYSEVKRNRFKERLNEIARLAA